MTKEEITEKFRTAKELVSGIEESFRPLALQVVFRWLLDQKRHGERTRGEGKEPRIALTMQINEFLASKNVKSHTDRILATAYYYLRNSDQPITKSEIEEVYRRTRIPRPKNLSDLIAKLVRRGYFVDSPGGQKGQKAWQITPTGEKYVEEKLR